LVLKKQKLPKNILKSKFLLESF